MKKYKVAEGEKLSLAAFDANDKSAFPMSKADGKKVLIEMTTRIEELQELLYAEGKQKILIVLQAMDAGGKDGTIRHVFDGVNPQGVKVASFKKPTAEELAHDYLWRIHKRTPQAGEIVIFNRSHYESVLVERVRKITPKEVWKKRYEHIRNFEQMLADEGTTILKFYLHIDKDEQKERFEERLSIPEKNWKFNTGDLDDRVFWDDYMNAFEDALSKTSTEAAPWYVIPANRKWHRNLVISQIIIDKLESLKMQFPAAAEGLDKIVVE